MARKGGIFQNICIACIAYIFLFWMSCVVLLEEHEILPPHNGHVAETTKHKCDVAATSQGTKHLKKLYKSPKTSVHRFTSEAAAAKRHAKSFNSIGLKKVCLTQAPSLPFNFPFIRPCASLQPKSNHHLIHWYIDRSQPLLKTVSIPCKSSKVPNLDAQKKHGPPNRCTDWIQAVHGSRTLQRLHVDEACPWHTPVDVYDCCQDRM